MSQQILFYTRHMLSKKSEIDGEEEVQDSDETYVKAVGAVEVKRRLGG